jgi:hypothetical protein
VYEGLSSLDSHSSSVDKHLLPLHYYIHIVQFRPYKPAYQATHDRPKHTNVNLGHRHLRRYRLSYPSFGTIPILFLSPYIVLRRFLQESRQEMRVSEQNQSNNPQAHAPPQWIPYTTYNPGNAVWFSGTFWRCEVGHTSGQVPSGAVRVFHDLTSLKDGG